MPTFAVRIDQAPMGKGRPRAARAGKGVRVYTPTETANWEHFAAESIRKAWDHWCDGDMAGSLGLTVIAVFPRTKDLAKQYKDGSYKHGTSRFPYPQKPDADNIAKCVCDALEKAGVLGHEGEKGDDKTISQLTLAKFYARIGEQPHVEIRLWQLNAGRDAIQETP